MSTKQKLPANFAKLDMALRSIGYTFETAVADVIDNSIDAQAKNILVRLVQRSDKAFDLAVVDDGRGMDSPRLEEALRFGSDISRDIHRLGKFGLGLKLASLNQAKSFRVVTKQDNVVLGLGYEEDGIKNEFESTLYTEVESKEFLAAIIPDKPLKRHGTLVYWSHLYRIGHHQNDIDEQSENLASRLQNHLRLAFHRFLGGRTPRIRLMIDVFQPDSGKEGVPYAVRPLNPFGYKKSGCSGFPKEFRLEDEKSLGIGMMAHVWPPNSELPEYKLPGGANGRQGFYFYRNDRLIQAGGWQGQRETEPHSSLARIAVDLDPRIDLQMNLDVKKTEVQLPPALAGKLMEAKATDGTTFAEYLSTANDTYRSRSVTDKELPLVPAVGMPMDMREILLKSLRLPQTTRHRKVDFRWERMDTGLVFWVDQDDDTILLNSRYRQDLLHGLPGSSTDLPAIKCLLFLLCQDAFRSERMGSKIKQRLKLANLMLRQAVKHERKGA